MGLCWFRKLSLQQSAFMLQSNLPGICACTYLIGQRRTSPRCLAAKADAGSTILLDSTTLASRLHQWNGPLKWTRGLHFLLQWCCLSVNLTLRGKRLVHRLFTFTQENMVKLVTVTFNGTGKLFSSFCNFPKPVCLALGMKLCNIWISLSSCLF